jgi:hypothetical protein
MTQLEHTFRLTFRVNTTQLISHTAEINYNQILLTVKL